jgi:tetratricopeptide (TPR) repeat protein
MVYAPVRHFALINFDDPVYVNLNPHVTGGLNADNARWAFTTTAGANWFPLTWLSLMADVQWHGMNAGAMHGTNVLLHAASTLILFAFLVRTTRARMPSALAALVFGLHPQHVESVAWIAERKDVLSTLFWMLTLLAYARYVSRPRAGAYILTLLLYCAGFLAKPMVVTLPAILVLLDFWPLRRYGRETGWNQIVRHELREKAPFFLLAALMSVTTVVVQHSGGAVRPLDLFPISTRLGNATVSLATYILKTLWPAGLAVYYPLHQPPPAWQIAAAAAALVSITALVARLAIGRPYLAAGWLWYLITILPVIGIIQVGDQARADRYTYIPMTGLAIMAIWSAADVWRQWPKARPGLAALCALAAFGCLATTVRQVSYWQDSRTLFEHANRVVADNEVAHGCLADALRAEGHYDSALAEYRRALAINPRYVQALINSGAVLGQMGRPREALAPLEAAVRLQHDDPDARYGLGLALAMQGRFREAQEQFELALLFKPDWVVAEIALANTLGNLGRIDDAIAQFSDALRQQPGSEAARAGLQKALAIKARSQGK